MGKLKYKLLKDLPELKAGSTFVEVDTKDIENLKLIYQIDDEGVPRCAYTWINPEKPNEWFEEIPEPINSIHWKPKKYDTYWFVGMGGKIRHDSWIDSPLDFWRSYFGEIYRTKQECKKAHDRKLAKVRLQRTSTFEPDFENENGGWIIGYDYRLKELTCVNVVRTNYGEPVRYKTKEEAEKSIKENRDDWLTYFRIKEEK